MSHGSFQFSEIEDVIGKPCRWEMCGGIWRFSSVLLTADDDSLPIMAFSKRNPFGASTMIWWHGQSAMLEDKYLSPMWRRYIPFFSMGQSFRILMDANNDEIAKCVPDTNRRIGKLIVGRDCYFFSATVVRNGRTWAVVSDEHGEDVIVASLLQRRITICRMVPKIEAVLAFHWVWCVNMAA